MFSLKCLKPPKEKKQKEKSEMRREEKRREEKGLRARAEGVRVLDKKQVTVSARCTRDHGLHEAQGHRVWSTSSCGDSTRW